MPTSQIELRDLVREDHVYTLTGVSFHEEMESAEEEWRNETSTHCTFVLDGVTYTAVEDPNDGYRSMMRRLLVGGACSNTFPPCYVLLRHIVADKARWRAVLEGDDWSSDAADVIEMVDIFTREVVLEIGTASLSDYYPSFVANFHPENMAINQ